MPLFSYDVGLAVDYLVSHALPLDKYRASVKKKSHTPSCAMYVRLAIEAGGITLHRTNSAKDYGHSLIAAGFQSISPSGPFVAGDVVVIQGFHPQCTSAGNVEHDHKHGHMAMYDGIRWISDFVQSRHSRPGYPGPEYDLAKPHLTVYRYPSAS